MTLYITDLDGTLLDSDSKISDYSKARLNELAHKGAMVTFATARTPATVTEIFNGVKLNVPGIVMTGAAIYDMHRQLYVDAKFLNKEIVEAALPIFAERGVSPFLYALGHDNRLHAYHDEIMNEAELNFYEIRRDMRLKKFHIGEFLPEDYKSRVLLMFAVGPRTGLMNVESDITATVGYPATYYNDIFSADSGYLELFAKGVNKAQAMRDLATGLNVERIVAFGDNLNDIPMLKSATVGVAVENAYEDVKKAADVVIGSNTSNAVVDFIYNDFFERRK